MRETTLTQIGASEQSPFVVPPDDEPPPPPPPPPNDDPVIEVRRIGPIENFPFGKDAVGGFTGDIPFGGF